MTAHRARMVVAFVLAAAAIGLAAMASGPALALAAAAAAAGLAGGWAGVAFGVLAVGAAVATPLPVALSTSELLAWLISGLGGGLVARAAETLGGRAAPTAGPGAFGLALAAVAVAAVPEGSVHLFDGAGQPALLAALVHDPVSEARISVHVPAVLRTPPPLSLAVDVALWLGVFTAFAVLAARLTRSERWGLAAKGSLAVVGVGLLGAGLLGLAQLLGLLGAPVTSGLEAWGAELAGRAGGGLGVSLVEPASELHYSLASRPIVDVLRLLVGAAMLWTAARWLRGPGGQERPHAGPTLLPIGAALLAIGAWLAPASTPTLGLAAACVLAIAGLLAALTSRPDSRLPSDVLTLSAVVFGWAWLAPIAGWAGG